MGSRLDDLLGSCCRTAVQDALFAAALAVLGLLEIWVPLPTAGGQGSPISSTVLVLVVCGLLTVRRRWPVTTCVLIVCSWPAVNAVEPALTPWWGLFVPVIVAVFTVGRYQPSWWGFWVVPLAAAVGVSSVQRVPELGGRVALVVDAAVLTAAYVMGRMQYLLGTRAASAEDRAADAERSSTARAAAAVADERARIARELHDVIAHSVTVMIVQAGAAEQLVDDPVRTRLALGTIRTTGKEAIAEMRRLVGLLRDPGGSAAIQPQPGTALLPALIDQTTNRAPPGRRPHRRSTSGSAARAGPRRVPDRPRSPHQHPTALERHHRQRDRPVPAGSTGHHRPRQRSRRPRSHPRARAGRHARTGRPLRRPAGDHDLTGRWVHRARRAAGRGRGRMIRVIIADDQELVRAGFRMILEHNGIDVVAEAADGLEAVARTREFTPDIVLMDIRMPTLDGIEATRRVTALPQSTTRVLILTTFDLDEYVYEAVRAGASGFLLKDVAPQDLVHAVTVVARGDAMLAPAVTRRLLEQFVRRPPATGTPPAVEDLTERELSVTRLVARGLSNTEIGGKLYLSEATIKTYLSRILAKLNLRDRVQLAVLAYECGLVEPGRHT